MRKDGLEMYKNYIFDLYGTLVDIRTDEEKDELWVKMAKMYGEAGAVYAPDALRAAYVDGCRRAEKVMRRETGLEYPEIEIGEVFSELFGRKGVRAEREAVDGLAYRFRRLSREYMRLYEGAERLLEGLKADGKRIYLLSNAQRVFTVPEIRETGIEKYFDDIFISSDFGMKKPEKRYMEALIGKHGLEKEECLMIGNEEESDVAVAARCGVDSLLVKDGDYSGILLR